MTRVSFFRGFLVVSDCILPENHNSRLFPTFSTSGPGGQISKVILTLQNLYQIVQFDELSRLVQTFSNSFDFRNFTLESRYPNLILKTLGKVSKSCFSDRI